MHNLFTNIGFYVLTGGIVLSVIIGLGVLITTPLGSLQIVKLTQWFGLLSILFLYISLIGTPVAKVFPNIPYLQQYNKARRATGVLTFYYALLHTLIAFFGELGGFYGLAFLSSRYILAIVLSFTALCILCFLSLTSLDIIGEKIVRRKWFFVFKLVYLVGILVLIHAAMLGTHFTEFSKTLPFVILFLLFIFFLFESIRFEYFIRSKFQSVPKNIVFLYCLANLIGITSYILLIKQPLSTHADMAMSSMSGMQANRVGSLLSQKKYSVSFASSGEKTPNKPVTLIFTVVDRENKKDVTLFSTPYEKPFHLIIASVDLTYFTHIHPVVTGNSLVITTTFPKAGRYMLYTDFIPFNGTEQQFPFSIDINQVDGGRGPITLSQNQPDTTHSKHIGEYIVSLKNAFPLSAKRLENGEEQVHMYITDKKGKPFTNLQPYLNAFGHMIMINQKTLAYIHVHPTVLVSPLYKTGGPDVLFMPMSLKGPIEKGVYRVFTELNPDGNLILSEFTITIAE